jgi:ribosomal protein S18 acetylase RimI-like enzyme
MTDISIRPFIQSDRQAVFKIGGDTAFFGAPIEAYMEDRTAFLDAFYAYYTDLEPEHAWVAAANGNVVGFLTGCVNTRVHDSKIRGVIIPRVAGNLLRGKYHFGKRSMRYFSGLIGGIFRDEYTHVDLNKYPAHLHINVDAGWRGYKLGFRLMEAYLGQLRELGIPGVHLGTTSLNEIACRLYEKMGFRLLDTRPDRFWAKWFGHSVENRCYALKL